MLNAPIHYIPKLVENANQSFSILKKELDWVRIDKTPRSEYYSNDFGVPYAYGSGGFSRSYDAQPWHPEMLRLRRLLKQLTSNEYEVCFLNYYHDQSDHLGWHADNSPEMDDGRPIAIISLGVERDIWFAPMGQLETKEVLRLENGSCALMLPGMQDTHMHRIPKAGFMCGERISLTFRGYVKG